MVRFCSEMYKEMIFFCISFSLARLTFLSVTAKVKSNHKFENRRYLRSKLHKEALKFALSITG